MTAPNDHGAPALRSKAAAQRVADTAVVGKNEPRARRKLRIAFEIWKLGPVFAQVVGPGFAIALRGAAFDMSAAKPIDGRDHDANFVEDRDVSDDFVSIFGNHPRPA